MTEHKSTRVLDTRIFQGLNDLLRAWIDSNDAPASVALSIQALEGHDPLQPLLGKQELERSLQLLRCVYPAVREYKEQLNISASLLPETLAIYIPMAQFMAARAQQIRQIKGRAALIGINGGQGSGKTTINAFLQIILSQGLGLKTAGFSIDDVYKTYDQRQAMAREVHPLFAIRSVAGTHDTTLAMETLNALLNAGTHSRVQVPRFDKMAKGGQGDRLPQSHWPVIEGQVDLVIFEGWCVGALPQSPEKLAQPVNVREAEQDPDGRWRKTMNDLLASDYRRLFGMIDDLLVIQVRSMEDVFRNRELQEQHLRDKLAAAHARGEDTGEKGAMSPQEVIDFISLYERTTRHMLATLPDVARLTLYIGDKHRIERVGINDPVQTTHA